MYRGTTPSITIKLPNTVLAEELLQAWITFSQNGTEVLTKELSDCTVIDQTLTITLTQTETLNFDDKETLEVQLRVLKTNGEALASKVKRFRVGEILKDGEISGG